MATKIQQILEAAPNESVLFGSWLSSQGLDARGQYAYMKSGWLDRQTSLDDINIHLTHRYYDGGLEENRLKLLLETMDNDAKSSAGKGSQEEAREKAYSEYEKYKVIQGRSYISDFDRFNSGNDDDTPILPFNIDPKE